MQEQQVGEKKSLFDKPLLRTKITSANVKFKEMLMGYLVGPFMALITNAVFASFLNVYYSDVLGITDKETFGLFSTLFPLISVIFVVAGNILVGVLIDRTKTRAGKARPFLLIAAPAIVLACVLLVAVPTNNVTLIMIWVAISYNLYYAIAYPVYYMSHSTLVPLSTRNAKHRGQLSVFASIANIGAAGFFAAIVFPMFHSAVLDPALSSSDKGAGLWLISVSVLAAISLIGILLEFYFTRERITEENIKLNIKEEKVSVSKQLKAVTSDKYWWMIIIFYLLFQFGGGMKNFSMVYFCKTVSFMIGGVNMAQTVLAIVGGVPLAVGMLVVWPLANKFGKKNLVVAGLVFSMTGWIVMIDPSNFYLVCAGVALKTLGSVPATYIMMALFSDVLEHLEAKNGFRCDGLSMSLYGAIMVGLSGIITGVFNGLLSAVGYDAENINDGSKNVFIVCFLVIELVAYAILAVMLLFLRVEKEIPEDQKIIVERQKAAVLAKGEEWIEPAERLKMEQEEADRAEEAARVEELKAYCEKKGLNFEEKEREYQAQKAAKEKKAAERAAAKQAKQEQKQAAKQSKRK